MNMREEEQLRYIDPDFCTAREQELLGVKREDFIKPDGKGRLIVGSEEQRAKADMSTEHRVRIALQRRSLALDQCDLMRYSVSESYHDFLFALITLPAPPNYKDIDICQILNADRGIWARMCEHTASGISIRPDGSYPMEAALTLARLHPLVTILLQPLQMNSKNKGSSADKIPVIKKPKGDKAAKVKGKNKGKGKGKEGKARSSVRMPFELIGCKSLTADGSKICFDCNLPKGCSRSVTDGACSAGKHVCCGCLSTSHLYQGCS